MMGRHSDSTGNPKILARARSVLSAASTRRSPGVRQATASSSYPRSLGRRPSNRSALSPPVPAHSPICWSGRRRSRRHSNAAKTSSDAASGGTGRTADASCPKRPASAGSVRQAASHQPTISRRAAAREEADGRRSRLGRWFPRGSAGSRFHRSAQGHADHGRQWSMSIAPGLNRAPVQTQRTGSPLSISCRATWRASAVSRVGSSQARMASAALPQAVVGREPVHLRSS